MTGRAALVATVLLAVTAEAGEKTFCVGGYQGTPPNIVAACNQPAITRMHKEWHFHQYFTDGVECFACYDECDNACDWDFLEGHPKYRPVDQYDCARLGPMHSADRVIVHMIDGSPAAAPPPRKPTRLEAKIDRVAPGPYTAGDRIAVVGSVRDTDGNPRPLSGGVFRVTDSTGQVSVVAGVRQKDGTVKAEILLPASDGVRIEFVPQAPPLGANEILAGAASSATSLQVQVCGLRAKVVSPASGEPLVSGQAASLRVVVLDAAGQAPISPVPAGTALTFALQVGEEAPLSIPADASGVASWVPPGAFSIQPVRLSASGRAGDRVVCPLAEVEATVSAMGLGFDTSGLPASCFQGLPCSGAVQLLRPQAGPSRAVVDALLGEPGVEVELSVLGKSIFKGPLRADDRYEFTHTHPQEGGATWALKVLTAKGEVSMSPHEVWVRRALKLSLPAELDFGTVPAGAEVGAHCRQLDFSASQAAEEHQWEILAEAGAACSRPMLSFRNAAGRADLRALTPAVRIDALDPLKRYLEICLEVPRCDSDASPAGAQLRVVPLTPEFSSQATAVALRWRVEGRGLLGCHGFWLYPLMALLAAAVVIAGFVTPFRFSDSTAIRIAGSERGIRQAAGTHLRSCPGSGVGFYRDARLGIHGEGLTRHVRRCSVRVRAVKQGVVLEGAGPLEAQNRRTLKWEPVQDLGLGHVPNPSALYRTGDTYFRLEA